MKRMHGLTFAVSIENRKDPRGHPVNPPEEPDGPKRRSIQKADIVGLLVVERPDLSDLYCPVDG